MNFSASAVHVFLPTWMRALKFAKNCKALYFHEPFIFANAVSNVNIKIKGAKISTLTHYALYMKHRKFFANF
jgi:hypothetical protein